MQDEAELEEIVKLVGMDALGANDRLKLETARSIREDFLHQNAFHEIDTYTSMKKQLLMMKLILSYYDKSAEALKSGADINGLSILPARERIGRFKVQPEENIESEYNDILDNLDRDIQNVLNNSQE